MEHLAQREIVPQVGVFHTPRLRNNSFLQKLWEIDVAKVLESIWERDNLGDEAPDHPQNP